MSDRLIDKLRAATKARRTEVTLYGMTLYCTPLTLAEQTTIATMHPDDGAARMAETLVRKVSDADGKPVFTREDKAALRREVAGDELAPLIGAIVGRSVDAHEKNSEAGDPSISSATH